MAASRDEKPHTHRSTGQLLLSHIICQVVYASGKSHNAPLPQNGHGLNSPLCSIICSLLSGVPAHSSVYLGLSLLPAKRARTAQIPIQKKQYRE
jgi:hypothetical protein